MTKKQLIKQVAELTDKINQLAEEVTVQSEMIGQLTVSLKEEHNINIMAEDCLKLLRQNLDQERSINKLFMANEPMKAMQLARSISNSNSLEAN